MTQALRWASSIGKAWKLRHLDTNYLWVQEKAMNGELQYQKIAGNKNAADLFTKVLTWDRMKQHMDGMQTEFVGGSVLGILEQIVNELVNSLNLGLRTKTWCAPTWPREQRRPQCVAGRKIEMSSDASRWTPTLGRYSSRKI